MITEELHIGLIQSELIWENPESNLRHFNELMKAGPSDLDTIILPEMFSTGFTMNPENIAKSDAERALDWMKEKAQASQALILGSLVWPIEHNGNSTYTNRLFAVFPDGAVKHYDKRHSFTLAGENKAYRSGEDRLVIEWKGFRLCPLICYDLRFPVWSRNTVDYDMLIYVANWPAPRISAWDLLLAARAVENMAYCVGVNRIGRDQKGHSYPGHSAVYGPLGDSLLRADNEEGIFSLKVNKQEMLDLRNKLGFLKDRDFFEFC